MGSAEPELKDYDHVIVAFSGGKDSLACLLHLLEMSGAEPGDPRSTGPLADRIELWHHDIDGGEETFMDWPVTPAYCRAVAGALGLPIYFSAKEGGFLREMLKEDQPTAPTAWENPDGSIGRSGGKGDPRTRLMFPQKAADLRVRWCSA